MLSREILTFLKVAELGSFTKAAKELYISTASVMKQINVLEGRIGYTLVQRSKKGITLTSEGKLVLRSAKTMYREMSRLSIDLKKTIPIKTIRIGSSILNPASILVELWNALYPNDKEYRLKLVPYEDEHSQLMASISQLGTKYDFILNIGESHSLLSKAEYFELGRQDLRIAVSRNHRLASKAIVSLEDLHGETLVTKENDRVEYIRILRHLIEEEHHPIRLEQIPHFFDINTFNQIDETGEVLVVLDSWRNIHPSIVTIPVDWDFNVSYGLLYSPKISEDASSFLDKLKLAMKHD